MQTIKNDPIKARDRRTGLYLVIPAMLVLLLVFAYPIAQAFFLGLFAKNLGTGLEPVFIGFGNYIRILGDGNFWNTFWVTLRFTGVTVLLELIIGMGIALVLNRAFRGRGVVRTIAILPWALPTALIAMVWAWIFNDQFGIANDVLLRLGLVDRDNLINWLGQPETANLAVIVADVWKTTAFISILLLAGLQSIPGDLYEAHALDGGTPWQGFWRITLPLLLPQVVIATLFRFAQAFGVYDLIQVMTSGGPGGATQVVSLYIYSNAMRYLDFGYAAALIVVTFLLLIFAVLICRQLVTRSRHTSGVA